MIGAFFLLNLAEASSQLSSPKNKKFINSYEQTYQTRNVEMGSYVLFVSKMDGFHCFCIDYCRLNDDIVMDTYPSPCVKEYIGS